MHFPILGTYALKNKSLWQMVQTKLAQRTNFGGLAHRLLLFCNISNIILATCTCWGFCSVSYLLWLHCRATVWPWSRMLRRPPGSLSPPHRWHPQHKLDQCGLCTPLTGWTGNSRACFRRGEKTETLSDERDDLPSHSEPPRRWAYCLSLLRRDDSLELRQQSQDG